MTKKPTPAKPTPARKPRGKLGKSAAKPAKPAPKRVKPAPKPDPRANRPIKPIREMPKAPVDKSVKAKRAAGTSKPIGGPVKMKRRIAGEVPHKPPPQPSHVPTEKDRNFVWALTAGGYDIASIGKVMGISYNTLRKYYGRELKCAVMEANGAVAGSLYTMATRGKNVAAAIWWTKTRMRWSEKITVEGQGDAMGFAKLVEVLEARRKRPEG